MIELLERILGSEMGYLENGEFTIIANNHMRNGVSTLEPYSDMIRVVVENGKFTIDRESSVIRGYDDTSTTIYFNNKEFNYKNKETTNPFIFNKLLKGETEVKFINNDIRLNGFTNVKNNEFNKLCEIPNGEIYYNYYKNKLLLELYANKTSVMYTVEFTVVKDKLKINLVGKGISVEYDTEITYDINIDDLEIVKIESKLNGDNFSFQSHLDKEVYKLNHKDGSVINRTIYKDKSEDNSITLSTNHKKDFPEIYMKTETILTHKFKDKRFYNSCMIYKNGTQPLMKDVTLKSFDVLDLDYKNIINILT